METVKDTANSIINTATNLIYGEGSQTTTGTDQKHENLVSGEGNTSSTTSSNTTGGQEPLSGVQGAGTTTQPFDSGNTTGESTNTTSGGSAGSDNLSDTTAGTSSGADKSGASATAAQDVGSAPPESGAAPTTKQQGADKPTDAPDAEQIEALSDKKDVAEDAMGSSSGGSTSANDAGPKPLGTTSGESDEDKEGLGSTSKEPGTGEKYIKSSGLKADGGDFDASNAGAGREADRLLEQKGVKREAGNTGAPVDIPGNRAAAQEAAGEKPSLGQKIKDKLHIGSKDKP